MADRRQDETITNAACASPVRHRPCLATALAFAAMLPASIAACGGGGEAPAPTAVVAPAPTPAPPDSTPDAVNGGALYLQHCSACHRTPPDERLVWAAGDGAVIVQAIGLVRIMNFLSPTIQPAQARDIARWLQDSR